MGEIPLWAQMLMYMVGGGGLTAIASAIIGKVTAKPDPTPIQIQQQQHEESIQVTTPWLVQNLLDMKMTGEATKQGVDTLSVNMGNMTLQLNLIKAELKRLTKTPH